MSIYRYFVLTFVGFAGCGKSEAPQSAVTEAPPALVPVSTPTGDAKTDSKPETKPTERAPGKSKETPSTDKGDDSAARKLPTAQEAKLTEAEQNELVQKEQERKSFVSRLSELFEFDNTSKASEDPRAIRANTEEIYLAFMELSQYSLELKPEVEPKLLSLADRIASSKLDGTFFSSEKCVKFLLETEKLLSKRVRNGQPTSRPARKALGELFADYNAFQVLTIPKGLDEGGYPGFEKRLLFLKIKGSDLMLLVSFLNDQARELSAKRIVDKRIRNVIELMLEPDRITILEENFWKGKKDYEASLEALQATSLPAPKELTNEAELEKYWLTKFPEIKTSLLKNWLDIETKRKASLEMSFTEAGDREAFETLVKLDDLRKELSVYFAAYPKVKYRPRGFIKRQPNDDPVLELLPPIPLGFSLEDRVPEIQLVKEPEKGERRIQFVFKSGDRYLQDGRGKVTRFYELNKEKTPSNSKNPFVKP